MLTFVQYVQLFLFHFDYNKKRTTEIAMYVNIIIICMSCYRQILYNYSLFIGFREFADYKVLNLFENHFLSLRECFSRKYLLCRQFRDDINIGSHKVNKLV